MSIMNMNGNGEKIAFRKTTVCEIVIESILKTYPGTEDEVCKAMGRLLKYAPDRKGGSRRK